MKSLRHTETQTNSTKWAKFRTFKTPLASTSLLPCPVSKSQAQYWRAIYVGHNGCSNPPTVISWSGRDRNGGKLINMKVGCSIFLLFAKRTGAGHLLLQPTNSHWIQTTKQVRSAHPALITSPNTCERALDGIHQKQAAKIRKGHVVPAQ